MNHKLVIDSPIDNRFNIIRLNIACQLLTSILFVLLDYTIVSQENGFFDAIFVFYILIIRYRFAEMIIAAVPQTDAVAKRLTFVFVVNH